MQQHLVQSVYRTSYTIRYDTIYYLHWKTDR